MFSLIYAWMNGWVNNRNVGELGRRRAHDDVILMEFLLEEFFTKGRYQTTTKHDNE